MNGRKAPLLLVLGLLTLTAPAQAQIFGKREPVKVIPPEQRVPELIKMIKEDGDENKRLAGIDELRGMDSAAFPQIVPALVELLLNDKKPSVRAEAAYTLGRYRPVQQLVGVALEAARDNDASMRVRLQARGTLVTYYLAGYRSVKPEETRPGNLPPQPATKEPPLANPTTTTGTPLPVINTTAPRLSPVPPSVPMTATKTQNLPPAPPPVIVERKDGPGFQPLPKGPEGQNGPDLGLPRP